MGSTRIWISWSKATHSESNTQHTHRASEAACTVYSVWRGDVLTVVLRVV